MKFSGDNVLEFPVKGIADSIVMQGRLWRRQQRRLLRRRIDLIS
jgi:hypothetical protein